MNLEFSKTLYPGQTGYRLSPDKTSRPTSLCSHLSTVPSSDFSVPTSHAVMLLSGQSLPTLESQGHFADPSTTQVPTAAMASLTLSCIYKWVFPWHPSILHILHAVLQVGMLSPLPRSQGAQVTGHSPQPFQNAQLNPGQSL